MSSSRPVPRVVLLMGAEDVLGESATAKRIEWALQSYGLNEILDLVGRISACLSHDRDGAETQLAIVSALAGVQDASALRTTLDARTAAYGADGWVLFSEQQLISLTKFALLVMETEDVDRPMPPLRDFFRALLLVSDLTSESSHRGWELHERDGRIRYMVANGLFNNADTTLQSLVYTRDIYLADEDATRVRLVTGLDPDLYWAVGHALHAAMAGISVANLTSRGANVHVGQYFSTLGYSAEESEELISPYCTDIDVLRAAIRERYSVENLREFDSLPLARRPLVRVGDHAICPSIRLLQSKVTDGLRHLSLDQEVVSKGERAHYLTSLGRRFEGFVEEHFRALPQDIDRFVPESELLAMSGGTAVRADGLLIASDTVVIVEAKSSSLGLEARVGEDFNRLETWLRRNLLRGVAQTWQTAAWVIERGRDALGLDSDRELTLVPVVLTLEELPMSPPLYEWLQDQLVAEGEAPVGCSPPQFLTVSDVTRLQSLALALDRPVSAILADRSRSLQDLTIPLSNYVHAKYPVAAKLADASDVTKTRFAALTDQILATLRISAVGTTDED